MTITVFCPRANHRIEWGGSLHDTDMIPCEQCGDDEFIRVRMSMETHTEWKDSFETGNGNGKAT